MKVLFVTILLFAFAGIAASQSSDANFPTPLGSSAVAGTINARAIGDSRATTYYYLFESSQGDLFLSVITKNFDGDIDVFAVDGMKPLTKLVIYSDGGVNETGRLIYFRKPEKLLVRIQGRPPDDTSATYQLKFGGSFVAARSTESSEAPTVSSNVPSNVNSVGTITEKPAENTVSQTTNNKGNPVAKEKQIVDQSPVDTKTVKPVKVKPKTPAIEVSKVPPTIAAARPSKAEKKAVVKSNPKEALDPLANIRLLIVFKDGRKVDRPMSEVTRVNVEGANLVVMLKDGRIANYSLLDVEKFTIQ